MKYTITDGSDTSVFNGFKEFINSLRYNASIALQYGDITKKEKSEIMKRANEINKTGFYEEVNGFEYEALAD